MSEDKLDRGRGDGSLKVSGDKIGGAVLSLLSDRARPVHVAVVCPPGAAITALLNLMGEHNGLFVMLQSLSVQVSALARPNGQPDVQTFPLLIFAIQKKEFETWLNTKYDAMGAYNMADIMNGKITTPPGR